ncbi:OsmC family protein [Bacillus sp. J33]|uniref:OsmC family protein n=1 Tax=Bacillus sp. J33 TaxID=935836 RepID=UPI00047DE102|nr:OsmC family protein [Bacillus sp. J33]
MKFTIERDHIRGNLGFGEISVSPSEANGYRPFELFVSSLIGCSGTLLRNILFKKRISYQKLEIEVSSVRNPEKANRFEQLAFIAYVQTENAFTREQAEKIADLVIKNCGMIQSVIQTIDIKFTITAIPINENSQ